MSRRVAVLPGDGIGPEVVSEAVRVLEATCPGLQLDEHPVGYGAYQQLETPLPAETVVAAAGADAALLGAVTTPPGIPGYRSPVLGLRQGLDLYANLRPVRSLPGAEPTIDLVVVRENTEGLYVGRERTEGDTAVSERVITRAGSERILRFAYELAAREGRRVTVVHKANVLRATCGLFRDVARELIQEYPGVEMEEMLVDACAMRLMKDPERFQLIVTTNLFGDILSDQASMLGGGLGLAASANLGTQHAVFEPVHGSAPDIAGQERANPLACIRAAALLLDHLGEAETAGRIEAAVAETLVAGEVTPDLGGDRSTRQVGDAVLARLG